MRSKFILTVLAVVAISLGTFAGNGTVSIDTEKSSVAWAAKKVGGAHDGHVGISEGSLVFADGILTGGSFVIDMTSISVADIENEKYNEKLTGHLNSEDFFGTEKFPTATLIIKEAKHISDNKYAVAGEITIKETTKAIEFEATISKADGKTTASAELEIDRTEFDVRYGSKKFVPNIGDKMIYDNFTLSVNLVEAGAKADDHEGHNHDAHEGHDH